MRSTDGKQGLVPVNYIDKLDIPESQLSSVSPPSSNGGDASGETTAHVNSDSSLQNSTAVGQASETSSEEAAEDEVSWLRWREGEGKPLPLASQHSAC